MAAGGVLTDWRELTSDDAAEVDATRLAVLAVTGTGTKTGWFGVAREAVPGGTLEAGSLESRETAGAPVDGFNSIFVDFLKGEKMGIRSEKA